MSAVSEVVESPLRLDLGAGKNKKAGFLGVDALAFEGVDVVHDLRITPWPWADNSVEEAHCSHFLEHLTNLEGKWERVRFFNELHRILKPGAVCSLVIPHWASNRYYGDPTHKEPFSEMGFYYLRRAWRLGDGTPQFPAANAPHTDVSFNPDGYSCDFEVTWGYTQHPGLAGRNPEYVQHALTFWKEACQDIVANVKKI